MIEYLADRWSEAERRVRDLPTASRRPFDRVLDRLVAELRRRLGGRFNAQELVELYEGSSAWTMALAVETAPGEPVAWEQWVADAAFGRYLRDAADWPLPR
jgi:hypothetical protein